MAVDFEFEKTTDSNGLRRQDVKVDNRDISVLSDSNEIDQNIRIRLQFYKGEWFLDTEAGVPYFEDILIKNPDLIEVDRIFKVAILEAPEVDRITEFSSSFDSSNRTYSVTFRAVSIYGEEIVIENEELII
jgi:hypothetical protein